MDQIRRKKKMLLLLGMFSLLVVCKINKKEAYNPNFKINYERNTELEPFATYSRGNVYICNISNAKEVEKLSSPYDVIVIDDRNDENPEMIILNSYEIDDKNERLEIVQILSIYEELYPSNWNRTQKSMCNEWSVHNILYDLSLFHSRTTDVNLDNEDESEYNSKILTKFLGN